MKLRSYVCVSSFLVLTANAIVIQTNSTGQEGQSLQVHKTVCPNYQLKCPNCPEGTQCVYPESGGCAGAGIPICQATNCHGIVCLIRSLPCPEECPFSCRYNGPACCPFLGEPVCEPTCQTFAPCHVTPCPEDCPGDCFYPDADFCCPNAGKAVCNKDKWTLSTSTILPTITPTQTSATVRKRHGYGYKSGGASEVKGFYQDNRGWSNNYPEERDYNHYYQNYRQNNPYNNGYGHGNYYGENYGGNNGRSNHHYHDDDDFHDDHYHHQHQHQHQHHDDSEDCPVCVKTITDVSVDVEFVTTTRSSGPIMCAQYIRPCPDECPTNCIYPTHLPCPFTHQPWCPSVIEPPAEESCEYAYNTEGYPIPYFPTYDPFHSIFTSILNNSGVTSTPSYITAEPTAAPDIVCPLIFKYCPAECPNTCLRRDVPCPFAEDGYCPGQESSSTITEVSLNSAVPGPVACPMYMLACPYCPDGFSCTREMTGYCPNTNVPYCVSSPTSTQTALPSGTLFEYYPNPYAPEPTPWDGGWEYENGFDYKLRAMEIPEAENSAISDTENSIDACAKLGFTRIESDIIFKQIQEKRMDCDDCPALTFDETCDNTCVYFTETSCCMQVKCLSNTK